MATKAISRFVLSLLAATLVNACWATHSNAAADSDTAQAESTIFSFEIGGYAKTDLIFSDFNAGPLSPGSLGRDLYVPATIPIGSTGESYVDLHAKESRINFKATRLFESGASLKGFLEVDFLETSQGHTDLYESLRLRHAYVQYGHWLMGQTWTTLFNVSALPENLDFIGPSESTIFRRQAMLRYSKGPWQFALENPRTTITPYGGGPRIKADDHKRPDAVLRYNHENTRSSFTAAGIVRQLSYQNTLAGSHEKSTGYGISLSGKVIVGDNDDFRWMASSGKGLGHYIGLNTANGAVMDVNDQLDPISATGVFGSYRHFWNGQWRSNFTLGYLAVNNELALTGTDVTKNASSIHLNLIFKPRPALDLGIELLFANRELENGSNGDLSRLQFSAKFAY
jgi:hypothetical protein